MKIKNILTAILTVTLLITGQEIKSSSQRPQPLSILLHNKTPYPLFIFFQRDGMAQVSDVFAKVPGNSSVTITKPSNDSYTTIKVLTPSAAAHFKPLTTINSYMPGYLLINQLQAQTMGISGNSPSGWWGMFGPRQELSVYGKSIGEGDKNRTYTISGDASPGGAKINDAIKIMEN